MFRSHFYKVQREKIGNILIYLGNHVTHDLSLIKALKLIYLIDEKSVIRTGVPITWLDHYAWRRGPVAADIYFEVIRLNAKKKVSNTLGLSEFINVETKTYKGSDYPAIISNKDFNKRIFSKFEMQIFNDIIKEFGDWSGKELEDYTHDKDSLYTKVVKDNNLTELFEIQGHSKFPLNFLNLIHDDPIKKLAFKSAYNALQFETELEAEVC